MIKKATKPTTIYIPALKASKNKYAFTDGAKLIDQVQLNLTYNTSDREGGFHGYPDVIMALNNMPTSNRNWDLIVLLGIIPEGTNYEVYPDGTYWCDTIAFKEELGNPRNFKSRNDLKTYHNLGVHYWEKNNDKRRNLF